MKPRFCLCASRFPLPSLLPVESAAATYTVSPPLRRLLTLAALITLGWLAQRTLAAQQMLPQGSPYIQPAPNYVQYQQAQPQAYAQPQYSQQYPQQQQQYAQPQYGQQPYADAGQGGQLDSYAPQQQGGQAFAAEQLEQLVAPIALYPDALVAQILAGATYPAQVIAADNWIHSMGNASPDQIAYGANSQTNWDPSIKALTAFPQVLDLMNHDLRWTTDLGNAYYNQPQDVLQTIQIMRQRSQDAGTLPNSPQQNISYQDGYIQLTPASSNVVYVPAYDPWTSYGQPVSPYPGFSLTSAFQSLTSSGLLSNGLSFAMSAFNHTPFGIASWVLNWLTSSVFFNQSPYSSQSTSVAHFGGGGGGYYGSGGINRTPRGFGGQPGAPGFSRPPLRGQQNYGLNRQGEPPARSFAGSYVRPALPYTWNRPQTPVMPARPQEQSYGRPNGYENSYNGLAPRSYEPRQGAPYTGQQSWRAPASTYQRNEFAQHAFVEPRSYGGNRGFTEGYARPEHAGGSHMFGGGHGEGGFHSSNKAPRDFKAPREFKAPKAPRMSGGHGGGHSGGGFFGHGGRR